MARSSCVVSIVRAVSTDIAESVFVCKVADGICHGEDEEVGSAND